MAGVSSDRLITCVADVATHVSPMSRLMTWRARRGFEPPTTRLEVSRSDPLSYGGPRHRTATSAPASRRQRAPDRSIGPLRRPSGSDYPPDPVQIAPGWRSAGTTRSPPRPCRSAPPRGRSTLPCPRQLPPPPQSQLALELETELPRLAIEPEWKAQQRLWGHPFHPMCSYLASFPAALAHAFIARYSRPGDVVLDPFAGRGTTPLQAAAEGRIGVGNDLNPFAHLLTASKVEPASAGRGADAPRPAAAGVAGRRPGLARTARRRSRPDPRGGGPEAVPAEVAIAFHPRTFAQLLYLRDALDLTDRVDRFLAAAITGILHGKSASYLSDLMPNTFSMAPRYVRDFAARTGFQAAERNVFDCLGREAGPPVPRPAALRTRDLAPRRRPRCRRPGAGRPAGPGPARTERGWSSPRRPTCGSSSTATTTGCGRGSSARTRAPSTPPSTTPTTARRTSSSCARSSTASGRR